MDKENEYYITSLDEILSLPSSPSKNETSKQDQ